MTGNLDAAVGDALDTIDDDPTPEPVSEKLPPYITTLPASSLFVDLSYQRPLDELRVVRMAAEYDRTLLGVLEVSERADGRFAIIDGHHRWALVRNAEDDDAHLVCQAHRGLTPAEEARLFYELDVKRRSLTGWDRWWARHGAGDPDVLAIEAVAERHGIKIGAATRDGILRATRACEDVVALGGLDLLDNALTVILAGYGNTADALDGAQIHGVALVLHHYDRDELDVDRLVTQLQGIPPRQVKARAVALREAQKGVLPRLVACVIVDRYNSGRGRQLEPFVARVPQHSQPSRLTETGREERRRAAIREWAEQQGLPAGHRIPKATVDAYDAAMSELRR